MVVPTASAGHAGPGPQQSASASLSLTAAARPRSPQHIPGPDPRVQQLSRCSFANTQVRHSTHKRERTQQPDDQAAVSA